MLRVIWSTVVPSILIVIALVAWWFTEAKSIRVHICAAVTAALIWSAIAPETTRRIVWSVHGSVYGAVTTLHIDSLLENHANMLLTGAAVVWYALLLLLLLEACWAQLQIRRVETGI
jgi:hypothetical protein